MFTGMRCAGSVGGSLCPASRPPTTGTARRRPMPPALRCPRYSCVLQSAHNVPKGHGQRTWTMVEGSKRGGASRREAHGAVAPEPTGHAPVHPVPGKPRPSRIPVWKVSPRRVPILPWHRVTHKWAGRGRAGRDGGASSIATGDWAARRTRTAAAVALGGTLSFVNRYSMLSKGMAPLFAGLGLYCHAPGGVTAPPGVTSLSPSREGL